VEEGKLPRLFQRAHGLVQWWYPGDGGLRFEGMFDRGRRVWERRYFTNGNVQLEAAYDAQGEPHGFTRRWLEGGEPLAEEKWSHGKRQGLCRLWGSPEVEGQTPGLLALERYYEQDQSAREVQFFETDPAYAERHSAYRQTEYLVADSPDAGKAGEALRRMVWYADRSCRSYVTLKANQPHGLSWTFFENGRLREAKPYVEGKLHGEERRLRDDGRVLHRLFWDAGTRNGSETHYGLSGRRVRLRTWKQGVLHGIARLWDDATGRLLEHLRYVDGKKSGNQLEYSADTGALMRTTRFKAGVKHGPEKHYTDHGHLIYEVNYSAGNKHGLERTWTWTTGSLLEEASFVDGKRESERLRYDWHGRVTVRENYRGGRKHGAQTYQEGTRKERVEYFLAGQKVNSGRWNQHLRELRKMKE